MSGRSLIFGGAEGSSEGGALRVEPSATLGALEHLPGGLGRRAVRGRGRFVPVGPVHLAPDLIEHVKPRPVTGGPEGKARHRLSLGGVEPPYLEGHVVRVANLLGRPVLPRGRVVYSLAQEGPCRRLLERGESDVQMRPVLRSVSIDVSSGSATCSVRRARTGRQAANKAR